MIFFYPGMLVRSAEAAGMKVPDEPDAEGGFEDSKYPHFGIFCNVQLGVELCSADDTDHNAKIIAAIPESKIKTVTLKDLLTLGLVLSDR